MHVSYPEPASSLDDLEIVTPNPDTSLAPNTMHVSYPEPASSSDDLEIVTPNPDTSLAPNTMHKIVKGDIMDQSTMAHRAYGTDTTVDHDQISGVGLPRREESNSGVSQLSEVDFHTLGLVVMKNVGQKKIYKVRPLELFFSDLNSNFSECRLRGWGRMEVSPMTDGTKLTLSALLQESKPSTNPEQELMNQR
nr:hypothetical protein Iba_chr13aCG6380 [Ipomoea batatas]